LAIAFLEALTMKKPTDGTISEPTDFGDNQFPAALVNVTNVCNLECTHCFVYRDDNPNSPRDKMKDAVMLHQLEVLRDKHGIQSMLYMGGEPMIRKGLVFEAMKLFDHNTIVTNGTYGIPSVPGNLVSVSLDGPPELNDPIRGEGVFEKVRVAIHERDATDGTVVMLQMAITQQNAPGIEAFVEAVKDWPISGVAFTFYVPPKEDASGQAWADLGDRDAVIDRVLAVKKKYPLLIKANRGALELMKSEVCLSYTGKEGENCLMRNMLPLYMGDGGQFERTFCCYGNDVDCSRCGAYAVFNAAYKKQRGQPQIGDVD
jgi:MoaA/NifB/PqqE/SkfB family radical SAM enzyme